MMPCRHKQKGLAAIEMVLVTPVLLMLLVAILELGRVFIHYTTLNKAVQAGARYALIDVYGAQPQGTLAADSQIKNVVIYGTKASGSDSAKILPGLSASDITVDASNSEHVTVTAVYAFSPAFTQIPFTNISLAFDLTASASMRRSGV